MNILKHPLSTLRLVNIKRKLGKCGSNCRFGRNTVFTMPERIEIGNDVHVGKNCQIRGFVNNNDENGHLPRIIIQDQVTITDNCYVSCLDSVIIGSGTLLGMNVFVTDNFHGDGSFEELSIPPNDRALSSKGGVEIGKNVWIGRNACIMPGVTIGNGAIIGANAVVTKNIPENSVAVGVPARVIRIKNK